MFRPPRACDSHAMTSGPSPLRVFLAEDSLPVRQRVDAMLAGQGMQIAGAAGTPEACVSAILDSRPDVVVLDVRLDGGAGLQVLQSVRAADPAVAFVVLSNSAAPAYRDRYLAAGALRFLDKSAEFDQLAQAVQSAGARALH